MPNHCQMIQTGEIQAIVGDASRDGGGGGSLLPGKSCPAWDFEWVIPRAAYEMDREYTFNVRLVYKKYISDDDVLEEYRRAKVRCVDLF